MDMGDMGSLMTRVIMASLVQHAQSHGGTSGGGRRGGPNVASALGGLGGPFDLLGGGGRGPGDRQGNKDDESVSAELAAENAKWSGLAFRRGSAVRWRPNLRKPKRGWQGTSKPQVGFVKSREDKTGAVLVTFPGKKSVSADPGELVVDEESTRIRPGVLVNVKQGVDQPAYGWGNVDNKTVGMVRDINPNGRW
jgi:hypothetical protein